MNTTGDKSSTEKETKDTEQKRSRLWLYVLVMGALIAIVLVTPVLRDMRPVKVEMPGATQVQSVVHDATQLRSEKTEKSKTPPGKEIREETESPKEELARLRADVVALSAALSALQAQVGQSAQSARQTRDASQNQLAMTVAYTNLKAVSMGRQSFARELEALKKAAAQDSAVMAAALQLEPIAAAGALTLPEVKDEFESLAGSARAAMNRASAQNWKERIRAEMKSLIDIRKIGSAAAEDDGIEEIRRALEQGKLKQALEKTDNLPEAARAPLKEWREKAAARERLEESLDTIARRLLALTQGENS